MGVKICTKNNNLYGIVSIKNYGLKNLDAKIFSLKPCPMSVLPAVPARGDDFPGLIQVQNIRGDNSGTRKQ